MVRPSWDEYFMSIAEVVASRATCVRRAVGAVIVKDKQILTTGYNGVPRNMEHCTPDTCIRLIQNVPSGERHELCRGLHGEHNAIIQAAQHGVNISGATLYCTTKPCIICTKMIINAGIVRVVYAEHYKDKLADDLISQSSIIMDHLPKEKKDENETVGYSGSCASSNDNSSCMFRQSESTALGRYIDRNLEKGRKISERHLERLRSLAARYGRQL